MNTVQQILKRKGRTIHKVTADTHVIDALHLMEEKNIGYELFIIFQKK